MLTQIRANQLLRCDFQTGELVWKHNDQRPDLVGCRAGHINNGYWRLSIDGIEYYACQIVWLLAYGYIPEETIDHQDGEGLNDALDNLRKATKGQNAANSKMNRRNTTGFKGVSICGHTGRYRASIKTHGKSRNLGRFSTAQEAHEAWLVAAQEAYGPEFVRAS